MLNEDSGEFFKCLGEIRRDITAIEFLMRCCIAKKDGDINKLPQMPYTKGKLYKEYPKSFSNFSFEIIVKKFNKRFPKIQIPKEIIDFRNAMAHGLIAQIKKESSIDNKNSSDQIVKFRENNGCLEIEFGMYLELAKLKQICQSLKELRRYIMKELN